jgi:hypothetical protein
MNPARRLLFLGWVMGLAAGARIGSAGREPTRFDLLVLAVLLAGFVVVALAAGSPHDRSRL